MTDKIGDMLPELLERLKPLIVDEAKSAAWERGQWEQRVRRIGLPNAFEAAVLGGADLRGKRLGESRPRARLRELKPHHRLVVLSGPPGTGKSMAAALWAAEQLNARWGTSAEIGRQLLEAEWKKDPARTHDMRCAWYRPMALVIDDAGLGESAAHPTILEDLMVNRYAEGLVTLVTCNLTREAFGERYGARIFSRLGEAGAYIACNEVLRHGPTLKAVKP